MFHETVQIPPKITKMDNHAESTMAGGLSYNGDYSVVLTCHHHHHHILYFAAIKLLKSKMFLGSCKISYNIELQWIIRIKLVTIFNYNKSLTNHIRHELGKIQYVRNLN